MSASPLRILVVLPMYGGSLPIGKYCAKALRKMGHNVRIFESNLLYPAFTGIKELDLSSEGLKTLESSLLRVVSQGIYNMAKEQNSQIVFCMAQAPLDSLILKRLRKEGILTAMWFVEDHKVFNYWQYYAPLYDVFAIIQKEPFISELKKIGQQHYLYLPLAAMPEFHKATELSSEELDVYGADIAFLGAGYPNRRIAFRQLADKNFKIWGNDWEGEEYLKKNIQRKGARISEEESIKIYNASKINLNLHSSLQSENLVSHGDFVNPRTFELASMGAFQLVDNRSLLRELFSEDELPAFDTLEEMYDGISKYLENPEERKRIAEASQKRVLRDHTYEKRMETFLNYILTNFPGLQKNKNEENFINELPGEFKKKLNSLITKLGLDPNPEFKEIVSLIRRQQGALSDLETAILFLDEWRKEKH